MGCLLAGFREWLHNNTLYQFICKPHMAMVAAVGALGLNAMSYHWDTLTYLISPTLMNLAIVLFIDIAITHPDSRLGKCLNWKPLVVVGILSYSLYLWQQVFLCQSLRWWQAFPVNVLLAFFAAWLSYRFVEKPFLRLRKKIEHRHWPPSEIKEP
jgi:peptidoglycan/LPS O-acetylase OafA/YrhL